MKDHTTPFATYDTNDAHSSLAFHETNHTRKTSSSAVPRIAQAAVAMSLAGVIAWGAGSINPSSSWANGYNMPDGSFRYANRDSSTKAQKYTDISVVPTDVNGISDKAKADRKSFGHYYTVTYTFNNNFEYWAGRPFWWCTIPSGSELVGNITKEETLRKGDTPKKVEMTLDEWAQHYRFLWTNEGSTAQKFSEEWGRMTGENFQYNTTGNTLDTSREYSKATKHLLVNWTPAGEVKHSVSFRLKVTDMNKPLRFAAGVYQVLGNWHYTQGKVDMPAPLAPYASMYELAYPDTPFEVQKMGTTDENARAHILSLLWEKNKDNHDLLSKLQNSPTTLEEFKKAVEIHADGGATVTYKDNSFDYPSKDTIAKEVLTKRYVPLNERTLLTYPQLTPVKKTTQLSPDERTAVADAIKKANTSIASSIKDVSVSEKGLATITFNDRFKPESQSTIDPANLIIAKPALAEQFTPYKPVPMAVGNPAHLEPSEISQLQKNIYDANVGNKGFYDALKGGMAGIQVNADGSATITYKDHEDDYPSQDTIDARSLVYKRAPLADDSQIIVKTPNRMAVDNKDSLKPEEIQKVQEALWAANAGIKDKLQGSAATAFECDNTNKQVKVVFKDNSSRFIAYDELVYTKGQASAPALEQKQSNGYTYNIRKIVITNKDNPTPGDWNNFAEQFIIDNWKAKANEPQITKSFINATDGLLNKFSADGANYGGGMELYKFADKWDPISPSTLNLSNNKTRQGILGIHLVTDQIQINALNGFSIDAKIILRKDDCFVSNAPAFDKDQKKQETNSIIDKIFDNSGLSEADKEKAKEDFKKNHQGDIDNLSNEDDINKLVQKAKEDADKKKQDSDAQKQKDEASKNLGLTPAEKQQLDKDLNGETNPDKIREKINDLQKKKDQEKQEDTNKQTQQDQTNKQNTAKEKQQQAQDTINQKKQQEQQQQQQQQQKAEEDKKKAELDKKKQDALDSINNNNNLKPEDKEKYRKKVQDATSESDVNNAVNEANAAGNTNKTNAETNANASLQAEKEAAKRTIQNLKHLDQNKKDEWKNKVEHAQNSDDVADIVEQAQTDDARVNAQKIIDSLQADGSITPDEANKFKERIKAASSQRVIDGIVEEAQLLHDKKEALTALAALPHLNDAQKSALKDSIESAQSDPSDNTMNTIELVKKHIQKTVESARTLDKRMEELDTFVKLVHQQKDKLTQKQDYINNTDDKKTHFDSALAAAEKVLNKTQGENKSSAEVTQVQEILEAAVEALGGDVVDRSKLQEQVDKAHALAGKNPNTQASYTYTNASPDKKANFDRKLEEAEQTLAMQRASQDAITQAADQLAQAMSALDGNDNSALVQAIANAEAKKQKPNYTNASDTTKRAFEDALTKATITKNKNGASAAEIAAAKTLLEQAQAALDGVDRALLQSTLTAMEAVKQTPAYTHATPAKKEAFDKACKAAADLLTNAQANKTDLTTAIQELTNTSQALDGKVLAETINPVAPDPKVKVDKADSVSAEEQNLIKQAVKKANAQYSDKIQSIDVDTHGNVTITYVDDTAQYPSKDTLTPAQTIVVKTPTNTPLVLPKKLKVNDTKALSKAEQDALKNHFATANPGITPDNVAVDADGTITVTFPGALDGGNPPKALTKTIPGSSLVEGYSMAERVGSSLSALTQRVLVFDTQKLTAQDTDEINAAVANGYAHLGIQSNRTIVNIHIPSVIITFADGSTTSLDINKVAVNRTSSNTKLQTPRVKLTVKHETLTNEEKQQLVAALVQANAEVRLPEQFIYVYDDGSAVVTFKDGSTIRFEAQQLVSVAPNGHKQDSKTPESGPAQPSESGSAHSNNGAGTGSGVNPDTGIGAGTGTGANSSDGSSLGTGANAGSALDFNNGVGSSVGQNTDPAPYGSSQGNLAAPHTLTTQPTQHLSSAHAPSEGLLLPQTADNASRGALYAVFAGALSALGAGLMRKRKHASSAKEYKNR